MSLISNLREIPDNVHEIYAHDYQEFLMYEETMLLRPVQAEPQLAVILLI